MGQYFIFVNASKGHKHTFPLSKACEIMGDYDFQHLLALLLLYVGHERIYIQSVEFNTMELAIPSLQTLCLRFLGNNKEQYPPFHQYLPQHMREAIDKAYLTGNSVGAWCGDRIILTGDYSDWTPFMPKPDYSNLYHYAYEGYPPSDDFAKLWSAFFGKQYLGPTAQLFEQLHDTITPQANFIAKLEVSDICNKNCIVVNLDKREYLNPSSYEAGEKTMRDIIKNTEYNGVMLGLMIYLTYSTGSGSGDLPAGIRSTGKWGGNRIIVCAPQEVDDFHLYKDVSNHGDVREFISHW